MKGNIYSPGPTPNTVRSRRSLDRPEKKGRKTFSRGVWAPAATIERIRAELEAERTTEGYARRKDADARRRDRAHAEYVEDFFGAVVTFLAFHASYRDLAHRLARAVTD